LQAVAVEEVLELPQLVDLAEALTEIVETFNQQRQPQILEAEVAVLLVLLLEALAVQV
jgi:hypothetical protein